MIVQLGHSDKITSIAYASGGKLIVSGSADNTVKLWDVDTGHLLRTFIGHSEAISYVSFSPDDRLIVSKAFDNTIFVWDAESGKVKASLIPEDDNSELYDTSIIVSPDGRHLINLNREKHKWELCDITTYQFLEELPLFGGIAFSPLGDILAGENDKGEVVVWDFTNNNTVARLTVDDFKGLYYAAFSSNGEYLLVFPWSGNVILWELATGKCKRLYDVNKFKEFNKNRIGTVTSDGRYVITADKDINGYLNRIKVWDSTLGEVTVGANPYPAVGITSISPSPEGSSIAFGGGDNTIEIWDLSSMKKIQVLKGDTGTVEEVFFSPNGEFGLSSFRRLVQNSSEWEGITQWCEEFEDHAVIWSLTDGRVVKHFPDITRYSGGVLFSPDNDTVLVVNKNSNIQFRSISNKAMDKGRVIAGRKSSEGYHITLSPDGKYLAVSGTEWIYTENDSFPRSSISVYTYDSGVQIYSIEEVADYLEYSPGGSYLVTRSYDRVDFRDPLSGKPLRSISIPYNPFNMSKNLAVSHDDKYMLAGIGFGNIAMWDIETGEEMASYTSDSFDIASVAFSPNDTMFVSGAGNGIIELREAKTGRKIKTFTAHSGSVNSIKFSLDGKNLLSGSSDGTMRLWDIETGDWTAFMTNSDGSQWLIFTHDGYWDSSPRGSGLVAMVQGLESWNIDQFAVRNNRPDLILKRFPNHDSALIDHYFIQYLRRLRRLGLTEQDLSDDYRVPEAGITSSIQEGKYMTLNLSFSDSIERLKSYNIYINDVPLFGAYGRELSGHKKDVTETIELSSDENKIEISCMNSAGDESFRSVLYASYNEEHVKGTLYYIGFGVSKYKDNSLNLQYAHKDAEDLKRLFNTTKKSFHQVVTHTFIDEEVTRENIAKVKTLLIETTVDDTVVIFISGHGVHDDDKYATYYFLIHETDQNNLSQTAIDFEKLETLMQGIPPRKKLFLMDTCGSGEWEPEMMQQITLTASGNKGVSARIPIMERGLEVVHSEKETAPEQEPRTYLYDKNRYIYNDVVRRSGAIVFSSCRGDEVSYEKRGYENGLFTEYIIQAVKGAGDADGDGTVCTDELQQYVTKAVSTETKENPHLYYIPQNPTVDRDNVYVEFGF